MTAPRLSLRHLDVPALAWWTERAVPVLLVVEVAAIAVYRTSSGPAALAAGLLVGVVLVGLSLSLIIWMGRLRRRLFPVRGTEPDGGGSELGARLREGGYVAPGERPLAGRIAWSMLLTALCGAWTSLLVTAVALNAVTTHPTGSLGGVLAAIAVAAAVVVAAVQIRSSTRWRRIATDRFRVQPPTMG